MSKSQCKINWSQYNKGLINRGNITVWFSRDTTKASTFERSILKYFESKHQW